MVELAVASQKEVELVVQDTLIYSKLILPKKLIMVLILTVNLTRLLETSMYSLTRTNYNNEGKLLHSSSNLLLLDVTNASSFFNVEVSAIIFFKRLSKSRFR